MGKHSQFLRAWKSERKTEVWGNQICNISSHTHERFFQPKQFIFNYFSNKRRCGRRWMKNLWSLRVVRTLAVKSSHKSDNESVIATKENGDFIMIKIAPCGVGAEFTSLCLFFHFFTFVSGWRHKDFSCVREIFDNFFVELCSYSFCFLRKCIKKLKV